MKVFSMSRIAVTLSLGLILCLSSLSSARPENLIPQPQEIEWGSRTVTLGGPVSIRGGEDCPNALRSLEEILDESRLPLAQADTEPGLTILLGRRASCEALPELEEELKGLPLEGYVLDIGSRDKRSTIVLAGAGAAGTYCAVQTLRQLLNAPGSLRAVHIRDYPAFIRERGYGEFFYGRPWSHEERLEALKFMGQLKMNFYMYSPKDDPYNRDRWREDYPEIEMVRMKELFQTASNHGITFSFAMNPGLSMRYSNEEDFAILMKKYRQVFDMGVRSFSLQLDDLGNAIRHEEDAKVFSHKAEAHAYMFNKVFHELKRWDPAIEYSICGEVYYVAQPDEYNRILGEKVDPDVPIMWTGSDVVDDFISIDEVYLFASGIRRKPFVSDNYPVNDFATNRLFMGPMTGRPRELVFHVYPGFIQNPMNQEEASKVALATIADYAWNPLDYDPETSWNNAILRVAGEKGFPALRLFCENNRSSVMEKRESIELNALIDAWLATPGKKSGQALRDYLDRMAGLGKELAATVDNPKLLGEISPWVKKIELYGEAGWLALDMQSAGPEVPIEDLWNDWFELNRMMDRIRSATEEVCGGIPERLIYRSSVGGAGLGVSRFTPSAASGQKTDEMLNPLGSYTLDLMTDGNTNSGFIAERFLKAGDSIQIELLKPCPVNSIEAILASQDSPTSFIYSGRLECSRDLKRWTPLCDVLFPEVRWSSEVPVLMRGIRLLVLEDQAFRSLVREFNAQFTDGPQAASSFPVSGEADLSAICDGHVTTASTRPSGLKADDWIEVSFPSGPVRAGSITLLMGEHSFIQNGVLDISGDRTSWRTVAPVRSCATRVLLEGEEIQAARVRVVSAQSVPVTIHELSVQDSSGGPY